MGDNFFEFKNLIYLDRNLDGSFQTNDFSDLE